MTMSETKEVKKMKKRVVEILNEMRVCKDTRRFELLRRKLAKLSVKLTEALGRPLEMSELQAVYGGKT